ELRSPRAGDGGRLDQESERGVLGIGRRDQRAYLLVCQDDVARVVGVRQRGQRGPPCRAVGDSRIVRGGQVQRRLEALEVAVDARGLGSLGDKSIAHVLEFPRRQQRDRLGEHGRRQQRAHPAGVGGG